MPSSQLDISDIKKKIYKNLISNMFHNFQVLWLSEHKHSLQKANSLFFQNNLSKCRTLIQRTFFITQSHKGYFPFISVDDVLRPLWKRRKQCICWKTQCHVNTFSSLHHDEHIKFYTLIWDFLYFISISIISTCKASVQYQFIHNIIIKPCCGKFS